MRVRNRDCLATVGLAFGCCLLPDLSKAADVFVDRLNPLNEEVWYVSDGWSVGNFVNTDWRRSQLRPGKDGIAIVLERNPASKQGFSSGEIQSRAFYRYGHFQTRLKAARGDGLVTAFFTYTGPPFHDRWDEIDFEFLGRNTQQVQLNYYANGQGGHEKTINLPFDAAEDSHIYAFDWSPEAIRWYIDGRLVHEETGARGPLPDRPQKIYANLWNGNGLDAWLKPFIWKGAPFSASISCIAYRPVGTSGGDCPSR